MNFIFLEIIHKLEVDFQFMQKKQKLEVNFHYLSMTPISPASV